MNESCLQSAYWVTKPPSFVRLGKCDAPFQTEPHIHFLCRLSICLSAKFWEGLMLEGPPNFVRLGKSEAWKMRGKMRGEKEPQIHCLRVPYTLPFSLLPICPSVCLRIFGRALFWKGFFLLPKKIPIFVGLLCKSISLSHRLA